MKWLLIMVLALAAASAAFPAQDQAFLAILAETSVTKMPGMGGMPKLPAGIDLSKVPGAEKMMGMFAPQRKLEVRLWSPSIAPKDAFASIAPPAGLKQGNKLDLELYRPEPVSGKETTTGKDQDIGMGDSKGFTMKIYWGCSDTVRPGQPKVVKWDGLTDEQKEQMKRQASEMRTKGATSYFYKPDWTTGYWPTPKQPGKIEKDASLVGSYALTTNYTGSISIDAPSNVNFLAPFELTSPDLDQSPPLDKAIPLEWKQIPNALGLHASVFGMEGKNTFVMWSSSEVQTDAAMSNWDYLQMAEVREFVKQTVMMKGDATSCTIPAGIFKACDMSFLRMIGYGPGAALDKGQPLPRIQTKTTFSMPLSMKGMGGGGMRMPKMRGKERTDGKEDSGEN